MASYKLNDNVSDSFEFEVGGATYKMRYPSTSEFADLQALARQSVSDGNANDDTVEQRIYALVSPVTKDATNIAQVIAKQSIKVKNNFDDMYLTEFGLK